MKRSIRFRPYHSDAEPTFRLRMETTATDRVAYVLQSIAPNGAVANIFEGRDFRPSPLHGALSNDSALALMGFLTLRPGDTDADYFADYSEAQKDFASEHAEALAVHADDVLGRHEGEG